MRRWSGSRGARADRPAAALSTEPAHRDISGLVPGGDDLAFAGAARQAEMLRARETSSRDLVTLYLERIERLDPQLNSYRVVFGEQALAEAEQAQARLDAGETTPLL